MEIIYIPGEGPDFVVFIHQQGGKAQLTSIDGHFRWVITPEEGEPFIARPASEKPTN